MKFRLCCSVIALSAPLSAALAQDAPPPEAPPPASVEGARSFTPADFARFAPRNALDMLRQVPGFAIREQEEERGLGQATGNVLLNGKRFSGKSNDILSELGRIPANNVVRIDIVDGATLDVPGLSGQVANVIAKSGGISGQWAWRPEMRAYFTDPVLLRAEASLSGTAGPIEYTLGIQNNANNSGAGGRTLIYGPDFAFEEYRFDVWTGEFNNPSVSGRFTYDGPGSSVGNASLSYQRYYFDYLERSDRTGPGLVDRLRRTDLKQRGYQYEMSGDYDLALGPGRLKVIGLNRFQDVPFFSTVVTSFADDTDDSGSRFARLGATKERIARAEYRLKRGGADWQISGEGAFNSLDNVSQLFLLRPGGNFEEIPLPGGSAEVKEDRYEVIASYGRPLSPRLSIQLAGGGEYSHLRQIGGGGLSRTFWRPKGLVSAAWKPVPRLDVNVKLQRRVGQLNFYDFLASVNLQNENQNAGNPDLVPQQSWELDVEAIRNLGAYGTTSLRLYGRLIDDIVDIIPIGLNGESPGNIDRATVYGLEWKSTVNFDPMGWRGAKFDLTVQAQQSRLRDPLTNERREISGSLLQRVEASLRHDIPATPWAYGGNVFYFLPALNYRLTEVGRQWEGPVWTSVFVEHKDVFGLTVRGNVTNLTHATSMWDRTVYVGRRTGPIDFYERRNRTIGPIFSLAVTGKF